jgi:hypothetical protein
MWLQGDQWYCGLVLPRYFSMEFRAALTAS